MSLQDTLKLKAVLFDMDGTILDTERIHKQCCEQAMEAVGAKYSPNTFYDLIGLNDKSTCEYFKAHFGFTEKQYEELSVCAYALSREYGETNGLPVKKGFFELSEYLVSHKIKTAVVTSSFRSEALHNFQRAKITTPFDIIIGGDSVSSGKPSPEPYLKAAEGLGLRPEECIAVEDSVNGIKSAHRAGIKCVYIKDLVEVPEEILALAEYKAESLDKILDIIENFN